MQGPRRIDDPPANRGFTLMEVIGVLAIMAILAAAIGPSVFQTIDRAFAGAETTNLKSMAGSLEDYINDNKRIPRRNVNDWSNAIAGQGDFPQARVLNNERGFRRSIFFDPRFFTTTNTPFGGYTQVAGLTQPPVSPRVMLVSDLSANAPAAPTTSAEFNAIWDQSATASVVESEQIKIQRLNLVNAFHRVILTNENAQQAGYSLESAATNAIPAAAGGIDGTVTRYVLHDTKLNMYRNPFPAGSLETVALVQSAKDYRYTTDGTNWYWDRP